MKLCSHVSKNTVIQIEPEKKPKTATWSHLVVGIMRLEHDCLFLVYRLWSIDNQATWLNTAATLEFGQLDPIEL